MKRKRKRKIGVIIFIIFIIIIASILVIIYWMHKPVISPDPNKQTKVIKEITLSEYEPTYLTETCFDGTAELNPALFSFPFKRTDNYIMNKELVTKVGEKKIEDIKNRAVEIIETLFKIDGNSVSKNYDEYNDKLHTLFLKDSIFYDESKKYQDSEAYISSYLKIVSDAEMQTDVSFETDKSLVYEDLTYYVRGIMSFKIYNINAVNQDELKAVFPYQIEKNKTYTAVYEIGLVTGEESRAPEFMKISSLEVIKILE